MAEPLVVPSKVVEVSLFRAGAVVVRSAPLPGDAWPDELALDGLPLSLDDDSVRVTLRGPANARLPRPADVRVELVLPDIGESLVAASAEELKQAEEEVRRLEARLERVGRELGRLDSISLALPQPFKDRPPRPAPVDAWMGVMAWQAEARGPRLEERVRLEDELKRARERRARLLRRDAEARARRDAREDAVSKRILLRLRDGGAPCPAELRVEYRVPGARWAPSYVVRVARDGKSAHLALKALVAQRSGESWDGVRLSVSTADLVRETDLPELSSLRIGRRQPPPQKRAWRDPPGGSEALFEGLDRALALRPAQPRVEAKPRPPPAPPMPQPSIPTPVPAPGPVFAPSAPGMAPRGPALPPPSPMAMPAAAAMARPSAPARRAAPTMERAKKAAARMEAELEECAEPFPGAVGGAASMDDGYVLAPPPAPPAELAASSDQLRFASQVLAGWGDAERRGKLRPMRIADYLPGAGPDAEQRLANKVNAARYAAEGVRGQRLPEGALDAAALAGAFDHRYVAEGPVDVPCDGSFHSVPLLGRTAPVETTLVVVPRESDQAVRVAQLKNPLEAPLLAGPADIYLEDEFLVSSPIRTVPAGGVLNLGLGIEEALKVARNTFFDEEPVGLMGGNTALRHRVEIEIASRLKAPVKVEVRERVPIKGPDDKEVEICEVEATPQWEEWKQEETSPIKGGRRWLLPLGPGESRKLGFRYTVKIDSKNELAGGNRRE